MAKLALALFQPTARRISCLPCLVATMFILFLLFAPSYSLHVETQALLEFKSQLKDPSNFMKDWVDSESPCSFSGISCDPVSGRVTGVSILNKSLSGELSVAIFSLSALDTLVLASNSISGKLPQILANASSLRVLDLSDNSFTGPIPDLRSLRKLEVIDLSENYFSGEFPKWVSELSALTSLGLAENELDEGVVPEGIGNLKNLTVIYLAACSFVGQIPDSIFSLKSLQAFDLSENKLSGKFPEAIATLPYLRKIELYWNNFTGELPPAIANLTLLREFDISRNQMTGKLPNELGNLKNLVIFQCYENSFTGELPKGFGELQHLEGFSIYRNKFSGEFPENFGRFSPLNSFDISENHFSGRFPEFLCANNKLLFLLALDNEFSGELPESYAKCKSLERLRISQNKLHGKIVAGLWGLPNATMIDVADNYFSGGLSSEIGISIGLNQLLLENNNFSGELPVELGKVAQLQKLSAYNNSFSGKIPSEIGALKQLSSLHLEQNFLNGYIPSELSQCRRLVDLNLAGNSLIGRIPEKFHLLISLNSLNLSQNKLSGPVPENLQILKLSSIDLSDNELSGRVPPMLLMVGGYQAFSDNEGLCVDQNVQIRGNSELGICSASKSRSGVRKKWVLLCIISSAMVVVLAGLILVSYRSFKLGVSEIGDDPEGGLEKSPNWKLKSFHQTEFDVDEIYNLDEGKLIGSGGTGKVYRLDLKKNGGTFAVKQLWKGKELKALTSEMDILGKIRHRNILKLYACLTKGESNFLVFEYMENGNLSQALRCEIKCGKPELDWPQRYKIAVGAAKGIAYLHHDCSPAIIHRDIKSSNILLNEDYEAKIADFGIAKTIEDSISGSDSSCFAGTHGYMAPELAYSLKVTEKSDVYSFGVVLLELITGRGPVEPEYGEEKDIVYWVTSRLNDHRNAVGVMDARIRSSSAEEDMMKVLRVAVQCTKKLPTLRPTMREVVKMLLDADSSTLTHSEKVYDENSATPTIVCPPGENTGFSQTDRWASYFQDTI